MVEKEAPQEEIKISPEMDKDELFAIATKLKKEKERGEKKIKKLEGRFMEVVKERNGLQTQQKKQLKLVEANETTIQDQEQELETAIKCLKLIFGNVSDEQFLDDNRIDYDKVKDLYTEMKKNEREKLQTVKTQAKPQEQDAESD